METAMKRAIVAAAPLAPAALDELKDWLGITIADEDAALTALLRAALDTCEAFTGTMPLETQCEEILPVAADWQRLETQSVLAITGLDGIPADGARFALALDAYALDFRADGSGWVRVTSPGIAGRVAVRFTAGLAPDWASLPDGLRHGLIRFAADQYRQRDDSKKAMTPPAAVVALWRPWRGLRLQ